MGLGARPRSGRNLTTPTISWLRTFAEVKMGPSTFFSLLFGSERFEPWIGELSAPKHKDMAESEFHGMIYEGIWPCKLTSLLKPWKRKARDRDLSATGSCLIKRQHIEAGS